MRNRNKWLRKKPPEQTWTMPDYPPQFQPGDKVTVENHGGKTFTVQREFPEVGYRGRVYELIGNGVSYLEYEQEMTPVDH